MKLEYLFLSWQRQAQNTLHLRRGRTRPRDLLLNKKVTLSSLFPEAIVFSGSNGVIRFILDLLLIFNLSNRSFALYVQYVFKLDALVRPELIWEYLNCKLWAAPGPMFRCFFSAWPESRIKLHQHEDSFLYFVFVPMARLGRLHVYSVFMPSHIQFGTYNQRYDFLYSVRASFFYKPV